MSMDGELWHIVEAKRDDGQPTLFRIRELESRNDLDKIFVVEMSYPATEMSRLPSAAAYRRLAEFEETWVRPMCASNGWQYVASKTEDGSFFLYMYGNGEIEQLVQRLSPFDAGLGFYDDSDPDWQEYGTLRELLDEAKRLGKMEPAPEERPPAAKKTKKPAAKNKPAPGTPKKKPATAKAKAVKTKPAKAKPAKTKPAKTKPAKTKPVKTKPAKKLPRRR